ncbi:hypothetical protein [Novosphingobium sp. ES2-1]|nr:hypothetical protein [Novosphingobium sp. ES2-1]
MDLILVKACFTLIFIIAFLLARRGSALCLPLAIVGAVLAIQVLP